MPFGEYVPFREQLSKIITRLQRVPRDFYPGDHTGVLNSAPPGSATSSASRSPTTRSCATPSTPAAAALVVQTNNATYGRTGQPEQQLAMSRLRAVEHGRAVVTAATSGISAVVAPDGTRHAPDPASSPRAWSSRALPLRDDTTLADRVGAAPEWAARYRGPSVLRRRDVVRPAPDATKRRGSGDSGDADRRVERAVRLRSARCW